MRGEVRTFEVTATVVAGDGRALWLRSFQARSLAEAWEQVESQAIQYGLTLIRPAELQLFDRLAEIQHSVNEIIRVKGLKVEPFSG